MKPYPASAYQQSSKLAKPPRAVEAEALIKAARQLDEVRRGPFNFAAYASALRLNQKLWTLFQADLLGDDVPLPEGLREDLLRLSLFVDRHTMKALAEPNIDHLDALIDVNRSIARGLSPSPSQ